jgi:hypothetical protein
MTPSELLQAHSTADTIELTPEQYQEFCVAVLELPEDERSDWDVVVLNYVYHGKPLVVAEPPSAAQGQNE